MKTKTCSFLLLCLGLVLPVLSSKCPDDAKLPSACECDDGFADEEDNVELSCSGITLDELKYALSLFDTSIRLDVSMDEMHVGTLPSKFFDGFNVVGLEIVHCELDSLAPQGELALAGLEDKLENLVITSSFTEDNQPTKIDLSHLRRLTELDLSYNAITEVSDDWFARGPTSLKELVFSNNGIEKIGDRAFANLVNLDKLELHGNRFGPIKRSMLPRPANKLSHLELDNNALTSLPDDLFVDMPKLVVLAMTNNGFSSLSEKVFKPIWSELAILDVRGNPIQCDSTMKWAFHATSDVVIMGDCEGPADQKGKDINKFIDTRGQ